MGQEAICDFPRSEAMTAGDLWSLHALHQGMADTFAAALSSLLRSPVEVGFAGVDQIAYGRFIADLATPSYFSVLKAEPLGDCLMLDIDLAILYPMLDRMLGGGHEDEPSPRRPPSDIELPLAARIVRIFLEELHLSWQSTLAVQFEVSQVESRPRTLRVLPSDETVAVAGFTLSLGNHQGMMLLCLPCRAVRRLVDQLVESKSQRQSSENDGVDKANPCDNRVEVIVSLATTSIAANDLHSLQIGDIIATETGVDAPAIVLIDGRPKFHGKPGSCHGRKAVVLLQSTDDGRD